MVGPVEVDPDVVALVVPEVVDSVLLLVEGVADVVGPVEVGSRC